MIPEDACLVLGGWQEKQSKLVLVCRLYRLDMAVVCRVLLVTDTAVALVSDSGKFMLDLTDPEIRCEYSEPREAPELAKEFDLRDEEMGSSTLAFFFGTSTTPESFEEKFEPESMALMELVD